MTAIKAQFYKVIPVPSRNLAQFVFEMPEERVDEALAALGGWPTGAREQWVGIAPITHEAAAQPAPERKEMTRAQWAGMLCQDEQFQEFLIATHRASFSAQLRGTPDGTALAAKFVRRHCGITSRAELDAEYPQPAAEIWDTLRTEYDAWRGRIGTP